MPPPLSEAWATAYVQILITLVVFALGVPALAIQLVVQDDIREVFHRRMRVTGWVTSLIVTLLAFIAFVWVLHPPFKKVGGPPTTKQIGVGDRAIVNVPLIVDTLPSASAGAQANGTVIAVGNPTVSPSKPEKEDEDELSYAESFAASVVMTLIPLALIGLGLLQTTYYRRQNIIKELEKEILEDYATEQTLAERLWRLVANTRDWLFKKKRGRRPRKNRFRRLLATLAEYLSPKRLGGKGKRRAKPRAARKKQEVLKTPSARPLEEETLRDLIFLGKRGKAGRDKKLVLDSLNHISVVVQGSPAYQGGELADLIKGIKDVILNSDQPGSDEDFNNAIAVLKGIRHRLPPRVEVSEYLDAGWVTKTLEDLGVEAVKSKSERTAERLLQASSSSKTVFKMGLTALDGKNFHTAVLSLNRLESIAGEKNLKACQETFDLLGLIAHFTAIGTATCMRADQFLSKHIKAFLPSVDDCLRGAYEHHYSSSNFETADRILDLRQKITSDQWSPLLLTSI